MTPWHLGSISAGAALDRFSEMPLRRFSLDSTWEKARAMLIGMFGPVPDSPCCLPLPPAADICARRSMTPDMASCIARRTCSGGGLFMNCSPGFPSSPFSGFMLRKISLPNGDVMVALKNAALVALPSAALLPSLPSCEPAMCASAWLASSSICRTNMTCCSLSSSRPCSWIFLKFSLAIFARMVGKRFPAAGGAMVPMI
mmetsp:Transcript_50192/g.106893  ORF Transcript_50192/g.106893 Transcript_50192/m.106893 type:complete len:200 (-) Transcript_50192:222-821(-)